MRIYSVFDPEFHAYGQIADGMEDAVKPLLEALAKTPLPEGTGYVPPSAWRAKTWTSRIPCKGCLL